MCFLKQAFTNIAIFLFSYRLSSFRDSDLPEEKVSEVTQEKAEKQGLCSAPGFTTGQFKFSGEGDSHCQGVSSPAVHEL